jgi:hypothetical protein
VSTKPAAGQFGLDMGEMTAIDESFFDLAL